MSSLLDVPELVRRQFDSLDYGQCSEVIRMGDSAYQFQRYSRDNSGNLYLHVFSNTYQNWDEAEEANEIESYHCYDDGTLEALF